MLRERLVERKIKTPQDARNLKDIETRPTTLSDIQFMRVPPRTVRNIRGSHMLMGIRDINRIGKQDWEREVARATRIMDEQRYYKASRVYLAIDEVQRALTQANEERQKAQKMAEEVQAANEEMEATNEELQASNEEMQATTEELERAKADLEEFASTVSHDLQEPLREIAGYADLLEKKFKPKLGKQGKEFISYIGSGSSRMQQLINDLLTYSRVGTKGKPFKETDCEEVLKAALINLKTAIKENRAKITHTRLPKVLADDTQLVQLFQNLIGNAIKFRSKKRPKVHISAKKKGRDWLFSVKDNGIGIARQHWEKIFVAFQRLHTRKEYPGTGIGLAVCKRIAQRHGGRIWGRSKLGKGSTFYFTISSREIKKKEELAKKRMQLQRTQKRAEAAEKISAKARKGGK